ncbi:hypothetical protein AUC61_19945 [Pseudomonas sp. S25]|uniref:Flp pilus assembly protein TadD, contains TPR repeats n=1 Tax=Pseudomonas maioricensis TaxID=1766623 RepID=A0ABS9ZMK9_9PSED|nr:tetratricopeptide repeat protein [Pseudomonas sp. S25]MCI8211809.1 hypothetical protein [Pseudomonas sp. S25]
MSRLRSQLMLIGLLAIGGCTHLPSLNTSSSAPSLGKEAKEALRLAHVLRDNGRLEASYEIYERMDQRQQLSGPYLLEYASVAATVRPPQEVLTLYRRAKQQLGNDLSPVQRLTVCSGSGRAYLALGMAKQAEQDFRCALDAAPNNAQAFNGLGVALNLQHQDAEARKQFEKALEIDPGYNAAVNNLALAWLAGGDTTRAIGLLNQSRNNGNVALQLNLALAYVLAGHDDTAQRVLQEKLQPERAGKILAEFQAARDRVSKGAPLASELLAASQHPFTLNDQD